MKKTLLMWCAMFLLVQVELAQNKPIDIAANQLGMKNFILEIESKSDYRFVFDGVDMATAPAVTANYIYLLRQE